MTLNEYQQAAQRNIEKLNARYPEGFDPERSQHRAAGDV